MGYSHYFGYDPASTDFARNFAMLQMDVIKVAKTAKEMNPDWTVGRFVYSEEQNGMVREVPKISENVCEEGVIHIDGVGPWGVYDRLYSCETLWLSVDPMKEYQSDEDYDVYRREQFERDGGFYHGSCKTRGLPYDAVVTAVLLRAVHLIPNFAMSSDGGWDDWINGRNLYEETFKQAPDRDRYWVTC